MKGVNLSLPDWNQNLRPVFNFSASRAVVLYKQALMTSSACCLLIIISAVNVHLISNFTFCVVVVCIIILSNFLSLLMYVMSCIIFV
jgi:hypothetical protein